MSEQADNISAGTQVVSLVEVLGTNNSLMQLSSINHQPAQRQRPDYEAANRFLIKARREMANRK
jgi:hypothetical protein